MEATPKRDILIANDLEFFAKKVFLLRGIEKKQEIEKNSRVFVLT